MITYETLFITSPDLSEAEEVTLVSGLAEVVTEGGGNMVANERMGRRRLAYPIKKFEDGVYTRFLYEAEPAVPKELERRVRISDKVLRWLTVRLEREWADDAKVQAVRDAQARAEAAKTAAKKAKAEAEAAAKKAEAEAEASEADAGERPVSEEVEQTTDADAAAKAPPEASAAESAGDEGQDESGSSGESKKD